ncbi:Hydrogenase transcriptional regulatory protein hupR1 [Vibrio palustris]|uniref:Hydrogenase transcriptional regulatory protein hupR1 n=2 Tax=Vibrio palustris TaxID=1918946 RepID=A0A1R4B4Y9_9VIBR|nr:Hydrogenase transcriptional regulatory protein hupR1 [Vibrio palustris]
MTDVKQTSDQSDHSRTDEETISVDNSVDNSDAMGEKDPAKPENVTVAETPDVGSSRLSLLLLDDEADIVKTLTRVLRLDYDVVSFNEGEDALEYLSENPVSIIISDMRMPHMDGAKFLSIAKELCPRSVRILLTGYSDMESTIRAVNEGGIHNYLSKPWDNQSLKLTVEKAAEFYTLREQHDQLLVTLEEKNVELKSFNQRLEEKVLQRTQALKDANSSLEKMLKARSQTFNDILATLKAIIEYSSGMPANHSERVAEQSKVVAKSMGLSEGDVNQIYLCALLHEIGLAARKDTKPSLVKRTAGIPTTPDANSVLGAEIVGRIQRFAPLMSVIKHQDENFNGTGGPSHLKGEDIPMGSRIIRVVKNFDYFVAAENNRNRMTATSARRFLSDYSGTLYDPKVVKTFIDVMSNVQQTDGLERCVSVNEVQVGTIVKRDVYLSNGRLMLTAGQEINESLLEKLKKIEKDTQYPLAIFI